MRRGAETDLPRVLRSDPPEQPRRRSLPGATVILETITPVIGGGTQAGEPDRLEPVRGASVRGQLRWWWRSLYAPRDADPGEILKRESRLWGAWVSVKVRVASRPLRRVASPSGFGLSMRAI